MTLGEYIAFGAYAGYLYAPLRQLLTLFADFQQVAVNLERMFEYLSLPTESDPAAAARPAERLEPLTGPLVVERVHAAHPGRPDVLRGVSFRVDPGSTLAIMGPTGAGKTTLFRLLTRLDDPTQGTIRWGGTDLRDLPLERLRRQVAVQWQERAILHGTLRENLLLAAPDPHPGEARLRAVLLTCGLDELVASLPKGLETPIGEHGATLSGGQRTRLALARTLLRPALLVLLDEPTTGLDPELEARVWPMVLDEIEGRTVLVITHRHAVARAADRLLVLRDGVVAAAGPPAIVQAAHDVPPEGWRSTPSGREGSGPAGSAAKVAVGARTALSKTREVGP